MSHAVAANKGANALGSAHFCTLLLAGLLVCRICGGVQTIVGRVRYGYEALRSKTTCGNGRTIGPLEIKRRVLDRLKSRLLAPDYSRDSPRRFRVKALIWRQPGGRRD